MHSLQSIGVSVSNSWAAAHFPRRSFALNPESPLICWSSLTIDLICSVTNSCSASSLTFRRKSQRIVSTSFSLQRVRKRRLNLPSSLPVLEIDLTFLWNVIWNVIFMIVTKCQNMLRWFGQNANQKFETDKMPTTDKSPDKMPTFGWHYVRLALRPVGILSYPTTWGSPEAEADASLPPSRRRPERRACWSAVSSSWGQFPQVSCQGWPCLKLVTWKISITAFTARLIGMSCPK